MQLSKQNKRETCYIVRLAYDRTFEFYHEEKLLSKLPSVFA